jgi:hypothetical protein
VFLGPDGQALGAAVGKVPKQVLSGESRWVTRGDGR